MNPRRLLLALLPLLLLQLGACGFQLRGEANWPAAWNPVRLEAPDLNAAEQALLRSELERAGARVADNSDGVHRLWIALQPITRRAVASSSPSAVSLWRVELTADFGLNGPDGRDVVPRQRLRESASIELDSDNPLTTRSRLQAVEGRLRQVVIRQLVFSLGRS